MTYSDLVAADSPAIYAGLGDTSGTQAVDVSGANRHGTYSLIYALNAAGLVPGGVSSGAVQLGGSGQYGRVSFPVPTSDDWTIEFTVIGTESGWSLRGSRTTYYQTAPTFYEYDRVLDFSFEDFISQGGINNISVETFTRRKYQGYQQRSGYLYGINPLGLPYTPGTVPPGRKMHVAIVRKGSTTNGYTSGGASGTNMENLANDMSVLYVFVNGTLVAAPAGHYNPDSDRFRYFDYTADDGIVESHPVSFYSTNPLVFTGQKVILDEFAYYTTAQSAASIAARATAAAPTSAGATATLSLGGTVTGRFGGPDRTFALNRATETDTASILAQPIPVTVALDRATETDSAQVLTVLRPSAPYDNRLNALVIDGDYGSESMTLTDGTVEAGEDLPVGVTETSWAVWVADQTANISFVVSSSPTDATIWLTVNNDNVGQIGRSSGVGSASIAFAATAGETYWIQVGGGGSVDFDLLWDVDPIVVEPADPFEYARVEVWNPANEVPLAEIPRRTGLRWQEPLNEPGAGEVTVRMDDPVMEAYPDLLQWGNIIKIWIGGTCVHGFRIKRRSTVLVSADEYGSFRERTVSGPSVQHLLDDFIVRHISTPQNRSLSTRTFAWHAPESAWYNGLDWQTDYNAWSQNDPPGDFDKAPKDRAKWKNPPKFPDEFAKWMWVSGDSDLNDGNFDPPNPMNGMRYWRKTFSIPERIPVKLFGSADERYRVYLDGEEVLAGDGDETGYTEVQTRKLMLRSGAHTLGIWAAAGGNGRADGVDAVLFTMMRLSPKGKPRNVIVRSNDSWLTTYVRPAPAWNRAEVLRKIVFEAQARGVQAATTLSMGFTGSTDTAGHPWRDRFNEEVDIGTTGLELQAILSEGSGFDVWVDPANLMLRAWKRRGTDKSASITLEPGRNLLDWQVEEIDEAKTDFLIQYDGGWAEWTAPGASERLGLREALVTLGRQKDDIEAIRVIRKASNGIAWAMKKAGSAEIIKRPEGSPSGSLIAVDGARPFLDFGVGDTIKAPDETGVLKPHRVLLLAAAEDADGLLSYDPVLEEIR